MKQQTVLVAIFLALVAGAAAALFLVSSDEPAEGPAKPPETTPAAGGDGATAADGDAPARAKPEERTPTADAAKALAGVVRSDAGSPVAGASVECYRVPEGEPDDEVRIARSLLGDLISAEDLQKMVGGRGGRRRIRAALRAGATGRSGSVSASSSDGQASQDPGEMMRIGMEVGGKLLSDPSMLPRLQRVMHTAGAGIEDDAALPLVTRATTDAAGAFRFEGLEPGRVELRVTAPRFQREKSRAKVGDVALEVSLEPAGLVVGEVRSEGRPLPGATVRMRTRTVVTGLDGRFGHDGADPPKEPVLVSAPGHVGAGAWANVATEGEPEVLVVNLEPAATIRGRVTSRAGEPVAGALVEVAAERGSLMTLFMPSGPSSSNLPATVPSTRSGADGTFVLEAVRGGTVSIRCEKAGFLAATMPGVRAVTRETVDGVDFVLVRESAVEGRVTDASGAPVAGAVVKVSVPVEGAMKQVAMFFGAVFASSRSGADGRYRTGGAPEGRRDIVVEAEGYITQRSEETIAAEETLRRDYVLQPGHTISGVVLRPDGSPCPGATVRVKSAAAPAPNPMLAMLGATGETFVTDVDGRWKAIGLQDGPHQVTANAPGFLEAAVRDIANGATDVSLTLGAGVTIRGRVVAAEGGAAVASALVYRKGKSSPGGGNPFMGVGEDPSVPVAADGTFEIVGLVPGPWELTARAKGYSESAKAKLSGAAGEVISDVLLTLPPGSSLSGRVLRKGDGAPVEGALVYVPLGKGFAASMNLSDVTGDTPTAPAESESAHTGPDGSFTIAGLTPGKATLEVRALAYAPATLAGTEVPGSGVTVELSPGGAVEGTVFGDDGLPREGATVIVQRGMGGMGARTSTTDREGRYRIERLPPNAHQLILLDPESPMGVGGVTSVTIRDGETVKHDFGKPGEGRPVTGEVVRDGKPFGGATLVLLGGSSGMRLAESDAAGKFRFAGVPPGSYSVAVQSEAFGGGSTSARVTVTADQDPAALRIEMSSLVVEGTVVDAESGKPVAMSQVLLLAPGSGRGATLQDLVARQKGQTFSGEDGAFRMEGMPAGNYTLRVTATGFAEATVNGVAAGGPAVRVAMGRGAELAVTVVGPDGKPVANASVIPFDASGDEGNPFDMTMSKITGTDGVARLRLTPGSYSLHVRAASFPETEVPADASQGAVTIRLDAGGVLEATVRGPDGTPVAGAAVRVLDSSGAEIRSSMHLGNLFGGDSTTDASGRVVRDGLRPGRVTVVAKTPSGAEGRAEATVVAGDVAKVDVSAR